MVEEKNVKREPSFKVGGEGSLLAMFSYWSGLILRYRMIFWLSLSISIFAAIMAVLFLPKFYTARVTVLPPTKNANGSPLLTQLRAVSGLSISPDGHANVHLFPEIVKSRIVLSKALHKEHLHKSFLEHFAGKVGQDSLQYYELLERLRGEIKASVNKTTDLFILRYKNRDPVLAAAFANALVAEMDHFLKTDVKNDSQVRLDLISKRLDEVHLALREAEENLREFQDKNRSIAASPSLQMLEGQLRREVEINNSIYVELSTQYEITKIEANGDVGLVSVLDHATEPVHPSSPGPFQWLVLAVLAAVMVTLIIGRIRDVREMDAT